MGTKRSLVEVVHDTGYGEGLMMHINSAFGMKDMRAVDVHAIEEIENLREALRNAREFARRSGMTMRKFASVCKITPTQLSAWTGEIPSQPEMTQAQREDWDSQKDDIAKQIMEKREERERLLRSSR